MRRFSIILVAFGIVTACSAVADGSGWMTNFEKAKQVAASRNIPILVDFSGSDWCSWCIKLEREVFSQSAFKEYAKENIVLFVADFPSKKKLPVDEEKQNKELAQKYGIRGLPTVLLLDHNGKVLAKTGYKPGGAEAYVTHIKDLISKYSVSENRGQ